MSCSLIVYFAVDWVTLKIYLSIPNQGVVEVFDLVKSYHECLITFESGIQPRGIILDPNTRYIVVCTTTTVLKVSALSVQ